MGENGMKPCPCKPQGRCDQWKKGLPDAFSELITKPFIAPEWGTPPEIAAVKKIYDRIEQAKNFWADKRNRGVGIALVGEVGTGKTHLMMQFVAAYVETTNTPVFVVAENKYLEAFTAVKSSDFASETKENTYRRAGNARALFIDDLGSSHSTPARVDDLSELIVNHHRQGHAIFWTSNLPLRTDDGTQGIEERGLIDTRAADRLNEICIPIPTAGLANWRDHHCSDMLARFSQAKKGNR